MSVDYFPDGILTKEEILGLAIKYIKLLFFVFFITKRESNIVIKELNYNCKTGRD